MRRMLFSSLAAPMEGGLVWAGARLPGRACREAGTSGYGVKAAGVEGRWISPFGPLRIAYGLNLAAREGERKGVFEFTIGSLF